MKHITYEVVPRFLSSRAVEELVQGVDDTSDPDFDHSVFDSKFEQLLSAIPTHWKSVIMKYPNPSGSMRDPSIIVVIDDRKIDFKLFRSKQFYSLLIRKNNTEPAAYAYWHDIFGPRDFEFRSRWLIVHSITKLPD